MRRRSGCRGWALALIALVMGSAVGRAEPVTLSGPGGPTLGGNLELADGKTLSDGMILMVHGTLGHAGMEIMRGQQERLRDRGYSTLAVTLSLSVDRRQGMFPCDAVHRHRHKDAIGEIARWIKWLRGRDVGSLTLWGHSRGGNQIARFATEHPLARTVDRYVMVAPATWQGTEAVARAYEITYDAPVMLPEAKMLVKKGQGDTVLKNRPFLHCSNADVTAAAFASYYADDPRFDTPGLLRSIDQPVLVVVGDSDKVVPDLARRLRQEPPPSGVIVREIVMAGHMFRDFAGDDLADAVAAFVPPP